MATRSNLVPSLGLSSVEAQARSDSAVSLGDSDSPTQLLPPRNSRFLGSGRARSAAGSGSQSDFRSFESFWLFRSSNLEFFPVWLVIIRVFFFRFFFLKQRFRGQKGELVRRRMWSSEAQSPTILQTNGFNWTRRYVKKWIAWSQSHEQQKW